MSTAVAIATSPSNAAFDPINSGVSAESKKVKNRLRGARRKDWQSFTRGVCLSDLLESIERVYGECSEANWDGYDAKPISLEALLEALRLIELIPRSLPLPKLVPEPDGSIGFEWYKEKRNLFVVSISGNNIINYAGLFGKVNKMHGTEYYADSLPQVVTESLQRLFM